MIELKHFIGKEVRIKLLEGDRSFYYQGKIIEVGDSFFVIEEIKEGRCAKPIDKILDIKEVG